MEGETYDDPKQVLVILNSLGVIGVTTTELKAFMKENNNEFIPLLIELKTYKKIKKKMSQQSKDKTKMKILQQESEIIFEKYNSKEPIIEKSLKRQQQELNSREKFIEKLLITQEEDFTPKHNNINTAQNFTKLHNKKQFNKSNNKENNVENRIITSVESLKNSRNTSPSNKALTKCTQKQLETEEIHGTKACGNVKKILVEPVNSKSIKSSLPFSCQKRDNSESCTKTKSFIRPQLPSIESKSSLSSKKSSTDPVTLYRKYKDFWDQLSIPGEENHTKLRWAVREKMLGQQPIPKPIVPHRIPMQRLNSLRKK